MKLSERAQALKILLDLMQKQIPLTQLLQDPGVTPFTKTLCFGFTRHYYRLVSIANSLVEKRPKDMPVWICLLLGLLQITVLDLPEYAVVQETVALLPPKLSWAKGFINAILRRFCREQATILASVAHDPDYVSMHPAWLADKIQHDWPQHGKAIIKANNMHPPMSLRVNLARITREDYGAKLSKNNLDFAFIAHTPAGIMLNQACPVTDLPGFAEGEISVQDGAAQLAGPLLELKPGLRVLDACCAPGGKLCQMLEMEPELAECVGVDIDAQRLQRVQANCQRLNLQPSLQAGDACDPQAWWDGRPFDRILIDAPCSATGIIRRHPDIKLLRNLKDIQTITQIQAQILSALWPLLAPGGILVYATCSIMPEENAKIIAHFLAQHANAALQHTPQPWGHATGYGWQILPGEQEMDGFFYAKIVKVPILRT